MEKTNSYLKIDKVNVHADGTATVRGVATDSGLDADLQRCDSAWLKKAMPKWFEFGNVREQHSNIVAGKAVEMTEKNGEYSLEVKVVDKNSVAKLAADLFTGMSIGIRNARLQKDASAPNGLIVGGDIVEVSLVDRPANPNARLVLAKSEDGEKEVVQVEELEEGIAEAEGDNGDGENKEPEIPAEPVVPPAEGEVPAKEEGEGEPAGDGEKSEKTLDEAIVAYIEKAVKSATDGITTEVESLKAEIAAKEAELDIVKAQLVTANNKIGPKRTVLKAAENSANAQIELAKDLRRKAQLTNDPDLRKGYKERATEIEAAVAELNKA